MAASTEVRVPLLDDELVALSGRIPPDLKLRRLTRKYIFKRSMEGTLPRDIIWRPKAGFGAPVRSWLSGELKPMVARPAVGRCGAGDAACSIPGEVERIIASNEAGPKTMRSGCGRCLTLEIWQQTYMDGAREAQLAVGAA